MVHRYCAGVLGGVIVLLSGLGWRTGGRLRHLSLILLVLVAGQAALGMWTVTLALHPLVVTTHLLGGFAILTLLWLYRAELAGFPSPPPVHQGVSWLGSMACGVLLLQIALGGWTSANYAAMACVEFPLCQGNWQAELNWAQAFHLPLGHASYEFGVLGKEARQTIHIAHRLGALTTALLVGAFALALLCQRTPLRGFGWLLLGLLTVQIALGLANVHLALPLANALAHNLVAAHLLACCVLARGSLSLHHHDPLPSPGMVRSRT